MYCHVHVQRYVSYAYASLAVRSLPLGTSVSVYGTVPVTSSDPLVPESTYKLDSASAVTYTSPSVKTEQYHQLFFQSPELSNEQHTLVITTVKPNTPFLLDYFAYTVPAADEPLGATVLSSALPTATSSPSQSQRSQSSGPSAGVLVACTLVPVCVLLFAALGFLWWRKRVVYLKKGKHVRLNDDGTCLRLSLYLQTILTIV